MKNMQEANGKEMQGKNEDLRGVLGIKEKNPFYTNNEGVLISKLEEMPIIDLQRMAIEAGTSARGSAPALRKKIIKAFKSYVARSDLQKRNNNLGKVNDPFTKEQREKVRELNVSD